MNSRTLGPLEFFRVDLLSCVSTYLLHTLCREIGWRLEDRVKPLLCKYGDIDFLPAPGSSLHYSNIKKPFNQDLSCSVAYLHMCKERVINISSRRTCEHHSSGFGGAATLQGFRKCKYRGLLSSYPVNK